MSKKGDNVVAPDFGGVVGPRPLITNLLDNIDKFETVIVIATYKEDEGDEVVVGHSEGGYLEKLGMASICTDYFLVRMKDD